jgi:shikimate kinase
MRGQIISGILAGAWQDMKVILIGYRATGKSTVGRYLSQRLKIPFADTDQLIEEAAGRPVKDLVSRDGWPAFREKEKEAVKSLLEQGLCVVATGGGVILSGENRDLLKKLGVVVYLKASLHDILDRLSRDAKDEQTRPQFTSGTLVDETVAVLTDRLPLYESTADFTVDTEGKSVVRVADEIYEHLLETGTVAEIKNLKKGLKQ